MYILGNSATLLRNSNARYPFWATVLRTLGEEGRVGSALELRCSKHPDAFASASLPAHFRERECKLCAAASGGRLRSAPPASLRERGPTSASASTRVRLETGSGLSQAVTRSARLGQ